MKRLLTKKAWIPGVMIIFERWLNHTLKTIFSIQTSPHVLISSCQIGRCNFEGQQCKEGKKSHLRVVVLLCCTATGIKKIKPFVIDKYAKPRCIKNVISVPYIYCANKCAWMTRDLFSKWLIKLDDQMRRDD
ncbi:hypothetical protein HPB49_007413 [Dermacentor silvarum]|uniref:Uncharacterized protein n=1 Tax=Dermacentor silvarum TaxID=543639 RepID=A0ACB8D3R7_DERSI|nr:hypothetical protein HPB49_007413 [Dermacentor silvarum]